MHLFKDECGGQKKTLSHPKESHLLPLQQRPIPFPETHKLSLTGWLAGPWDLLSLSQLQLHTATPDNFYFGPKNQS